MHATYRIQHRIEVQHLNVKSMSHATKIYSENKNKKKWGLTER